MDLSESELDTVMLEKPDLRDDAIVTCLRESFGLAISGIEFLPIGADSNAAVYRATAADSAPYFVKLKRGAFDEIGVTLPGFLHRQGIDHLIAPLVTLSGQLWAGLDPYIVVVYPFVDGDNAYHIPLTDQHWIEFGATLRRIQSVTLPASLQSQIRRETFTPADWLARMRGILDRLANDIWRDSVAIQAAEFLRGKAGVIRDLTARTERLAKELQADPPPFVICHSDLHAGNLLIDKSGSLYLVDWDTPILAPKERDLMYPGGAQFANHRTPHEEETLFYRGYGPTEINPHALAYYRYERILEDLVIYSEGLLLTEAGGADRAQSYHYLTANFKSGGTLEAAASVDRIA